MALYKTISNDELRGLGLLPTSDQTQMYNALGRNTGSDENFFTRRGKSLENAFGTTFAAPISFVDSAIHSQDTQNIVNNADQSERDILKKYGYNNRDEYYDTLDALEASGDMDTYNNLVGTVGKEIKDLYEGTQRNLEQRANDWADYRNNSYVGQKINQDRGKFAGSAMNTLSTMTDVLLPTAGVGLNAAQGVWEGFADELEQNGLDNFDLNRAAENAVIGGTTGAITGGLNKGLNKIAAAPGNSLAKRALNYTPIKSNNPLAQIANNTYQGALRGSLSGAVGGATGAGMSAAMNGQDVLGSAVEGAKRGLTQGAMAGGVMGGANAALSNTPGIGNVMKQLNEAGDNWKQSGEDFNERLTNTLTSGDSRVGDWLQGNRRSGLLQTAGTLGNRIKDVSDTPNETSVKPAIELPTERDGTYAYVDPNTRKVTYYTPDDLARIAKTAESEGTFKGWSDSPEMQKLNQDGWTLAEVYQRHNPNLNGDHDDNIKSILTVGTDENAKFNNWMQSLKNGVDNTAIKSKNTGTMDNNPIPRDIMEAYATIRSDYNDPTKMQLETTPKGNLRLYYDGEDTGLTYRNNLSQETVDLLRDNGNWRNETPTTAGGWLKQAGKRIVEDINDKPLGLSIKNVGDREIPEDIQNMRINRGTQETPETEIYNKLTGKNKLNDYEDVLAYGDSGLATGKTKGQNILSRAGRAMEAAQAGATRKETSDIGIKNAGELIDKVRRRTGISNLEKQAGFASELTGSKEALLDRIQNNAMNATEDGSTRMVDLTDLEPKINRIVDDAPSTLIKPKQKEEIKAAIMQDLTNGGISAIEKANNFKSSASQLYAKNRRNADKGDVAEASIYMKVADLVDEKSYSAIPKENVDGMFDTAISEARGRARQAAAEGRKEYETAYKNLADELESSDRTIPAFRSIKKDFVDISKLYDKSSQGTTAWNNNNLAMGTAAMAALGSGNPLLAVPAAVLTKSLTPLAGELGTSAAAKVGGKLADLGEMVSTKTLGNSGRNSGKNVEPIDITKAQTQIYNAIGRESGQSNAEQAKTAEYLAGAVQEAQGANMEPTTLEQLANPTVNASTNVYNSLSGNTGNTMPTGNLGTTATTATETTANPAVTGNSYFPKTGDYWTDILGRAMTIAIDADDGASFGALYEMYQNQLEKLSKTQSSSTKLTDTQRRADAAMNSLNRISNMTPDLAYNLSSIPVIGNIANWGGNDYGSEATSLAQQIGYMVSGANIKEEEAENIGKAYVPQPWDNEQVRRNKLQRAYEIISRYRAGTSDELV